MASRRVIFRLRVQWRFNGNAHAGSTSLSASTALAGGARPRSPPWGGGMHPVSEPVLGIFLLSNPAVDPSLVAQAFSCR